MRITCKQATDFISKNEENKLTFFQRRQLTLHLIICKFCRRFKKQNKLIIRSFSNKYAEQDMLLSTKDKTDLIITLQENDI